MAVSPTFRPDSRFYALGPEFADPVRPAEFPKSLIRFRNDRAAATVGLDTLNDEEWCAAFARFEPLPGAQPEPVAMRYHGHQFRHYNPDLGDGRGFLYAQMREAGPDERGFDRLLDLGTKGSGKTPFSRFGDGRLTLKGGVREVLAAEMLEALGVPTSRAFSLIETGEALQRNDEPSPTRSAVLTRLSYSHIRFGSFQRHAFHERADLVRILAEHVLETYYPGIEGPAGLLAAVVARSARLAARWMAAGFVHGVLNTDNLNMTGESFDYGPWRFLPFNNPGFTAAYFDENGLYAFGRQPEAVFWNLQQLAGALNLIEESDRLVEALNGFGAAYREALCEALLNRLGLKSRGPEEDLVLANLAFRAIGEGGQTLRWEPFFFDWFCGPASERRALEGPRAGLYDGPEFGAFRDQAALHEPERPERLDDAYFAGAEPQEMLYDEVEALWALIADGDDWSAFDAKIGRLRAAGAALALGR
jgi:serine/tyrosine/threonine adenylyltransferase